MTTPKRKAAASANAAQKDPLGKAIEEHGITWGALIFFTTILCAIGGAVLAYGLTREPRSVLWMSVGGVVLGLGVLLFAMNVANTGRRLELRKKGIRFVQSGTTTEILWAEIVAVEVDRLDATSVGPVHKYTKSHDAVSPSSILTKTEWNVTIQASDGRAIELRPSFFRIVGDPKKLISHLKLRAGI